MNRPLLSTLAAACVAATILGCRDDGERASGAPSADPPSADTPASDTPAASDGADGAAAGETAGDRAALEARIASLEVRIRDARGDEEVALRRELLEAQESLRDLLAAERDALK